VVLILTLATRSLVAFLFQQEASNYEGKLEVGNATILATILDHRLYLLSRNEAIEFYEEASGS
jgi:hypothetical protein